MIGVIVTGHNGFAQGLLQAAKLLIGDTPHIAAVDFLSHESEETLQQHLKEQLQDMKDCNKIFIFCDIMGGSPFKNAVSLCYGRNDVHILYGVSLPMMVELCMKLFMEQEDTGNDDLADELIEVGRRQIGKFQ